ncbi:MAG: NAD(P)-binding domain-containing protein [Bradyrhizobium sp.]
MKIGIAGLGRMGGAIAKRLIDVGHNVAVWNRDPTKSKPLGEQGAVLAASPKELAERVDLVITILTDAAAIESVYNGSAVCWRVMSRASSL